MCATVRSFVRFSLLLYCYCCCGFFQFFFSFSKHKTVIRILWWNGYMHAWNVQYVLFVVVGVTLDILCIECVTELYQNYFALQIMFSVPLKMNEVASNSDSLGELYSNFGQKFVSWINCSNQIYDMNSWMS